MRTCIVCRCTDDLACVDPIEGVCSWIKRIGKDKGVCSSCPVPAAAVHLTAKERADRKELRDKVRRIDQHRRMQFNNARSAQEGYEAAVEQLRGFEQRVVP